MPGLDPASLALAFVLTLTEMTEVVALVFALRPESGSIRNGATGAIAGTAVVGGIALVAGSLLIRLPERALLAGSAVVLLAFGLFLFRSTLRSYRRARAASGPAPAQTGERAVQFAGGFTVGTIESIEAVIVLLGIAAGGQGFSAIVGAVTAGAVLVALAAVVHERIRRIKVPTLKLVGTSMLFSFAVFWGGEAAGVAWPYGDLALVPLVLLFLLAVRGLVALRLGPTPVVPVQTKG
jgi:Ca2+/H+ antiporter, TMEM165/GDT1 family